MTPIPFREQNITYNPPEGIFDMSERPMAAARFHLSTP